MDHDDQWSFSERDVVDLHAIAVGVGVSHSIVEWLDGSDRGRQGEGQEQDQGQGDEALSWACHGRSIVWKCRTLVPHGVADSRITIQLKMIVD